MKAKRGRGNREECGMWYNQSKRNKELQIGRKNWLSWLGKNGWIDVLRIQLNGKQSGKEGQEKEYE